MVRGRATPRRERERERERGASSVTDCDATVARHPHVALLELSDRLVVQAAHHPVRGERIAQLLPLQPCPLVGGRLGGFLRPDHTLLELLVALRCLADIVLDRLRPHSASEAAQNGTRTYGQCRFSWLPKTRLLDHVRAPFQSGLLGAGFVVLHGLRWATTCPTMRWRRRKTEAANLRKFNRHLRKFKVAATHTAHLAFASVSFLDARFMFFARSRYLLLAVYYNNTPHPVKITNTYLNLHLHHKNQPHIAVPAWCPPAREERSASTSALR